MRPRAWPRAVAVTSVLCMLAAVGLGLWWWHSKGFEVKPFHFRPLPTDRPFVDAASSHYFDVRGTVTLRREETPGRRLVTFEVLTENKSGQPIYGLLVTAELPESLAPYGGAQWLTFGSLSNPVDLVPGEAPYGLISRRIQNLPDPHSMTPEERQQFYEALRQPIGLGLWWKDGEEFLELFPKDVDYIGFPEWVD